MIKRTLVCLILCGLMATGSLTAHHSLAGTYDIKKTERATGTVKKVAFTNPHGALTIEIKNAEGAVKDWILTTGSSNVLTTAGITATGPDRLKQGDTIQVTFNPSLNGSNLGFLRSITLQGKKEVEFAPI
jgi:hypothetical protein